MKAFVPAAGYGTRLKPITDHIPKPLLPVLGRPVIELVIERLISAGIRDIGVNMHHKHELIENWAENYLYSECISLFYEPEILGTGGALKAAEAFLGEDGPFLVHNSDILSEIDIKGLIKTHEERDDIITLAVHDRPGLNVLHLNEEGLFTGLAGAQDEDYHQRGKRRVAFTGIAVYSPEFLPYLPAGVSHVVDSWTKAVKRGERIGTFDVTGSYWTDIGDIGCYAAAIRRQIKRDGERCFIHRGARGCENISIEEIAVIEADVRLSGDISLENTIILPGTSLNGPLKLSNIIAGPGFKVTYDVLNNHEIPGHDMPGEIPGSGMPGRFFGRDIKEMTSSLLHGGGSDRSYFRLKAGDKSAVLLSAPADDPDFDRLLEYTRFFKSMGLSVPELLDFSPEDGAALFEDLGDMSLYNWMKCPRQAEPVERMYRSVLDRLLRLHLVPREASDMEIPEFRDFDYEYLRWETSYFLEEFVKGYRGVQPENKDELEDDMHRLALYVNDLPKNIIHRDCQSQNIIIGGDSGPCMIDFQGARLGAAAYDLASLIWDPYVMLEDDLRSRLLEYYIEARMKQDGEKFDSDLFGSSVGPCRLQRHMQALGAFAFLSGKKGKAYFEKYIPAAIQLLGDAMRPLEATFPSLGSLFGRIRVGGRTAFRPG